MAKRLKNWPSRLAALQAAAHREPFAWGMHDCCLWAADAVLACTGEDPAAAWRGTYSDAAGAVALLASLGGIQAAGDLTGSRLTHPSLAGPGDIGLLLVDGREVLAVHSGQCWLLAGSDGLLPWPDPALMAWRVGGAHG